MDKCHICDVCKYIHIGENIKMKVELKKATKKILAVGSAALVASSGVAAAGLNDYPQNFVNNGAFDGQVVVGSGAGADDSAAAAAVIEDLKSEFSGDADKVQINYRKVGEGSAFTLINTPGDQMNYGEMVATEAELIDEDSDLPMFEVKKFDNSEDDTTYEQSLEFLNGDFNFGLRDSLDNDEEEMEDAADHIYYADDTSYAQYIIEFDEDVNSTQEDDFIGETLSFMCNDFIISGVTTSNSMITELELLGGANKVALGEGETAQVTFEGNTYDLKVLTVDTEGSGQGEVVISVNGVTKAVTEFSNEEIGGVTVAVTEVVDSDRDSAKGYAEIVFGGGKVTLKDDAEVEINDEKITKETDNMYYVSADLNADGHTGFGKFVVDFKVDQDTVLTAGESVVDPVFGCFALNYNGLEESTYSDVTLTAGEDEDEVQLSATLDNGDNFNDFVIAVNTTSAYLKGKSDGDRIFFKGSQDVGDNAVFDAAVTGNTLTLDFNSSTQKGWGFFMYESSDEQYLYRMSAIDNNNNEIDFEELIAGKDEVDIETNELNSSLQVKNFVTAYDSVSADIDLVHYNTVNGERVYSFEPVVKFENERIMNFSQIEEVNSSYGWLTFSLDDVSGDSDADELETIRIDFNSTMNNNDVDSELNLNQAGSQFKNYNVADLSNDVSESNDDERIYVTSYGTKVSIDSSNDNYEVVIMTPKSQTYGRVDVTFGNNVGSSNEVSIVVDADQVEAKKADLEADGFEVVGTSTVSSDAVEFDVTAPVMDSAASGSDMIVVGGPAINSVARDLLGISEYSMDQAGVSEGQYVVRYFESQNSVLVYGYSKADTMSAVEKLNAGGLSGNEVRN